MNSERKTYRLLYIFLLTAFAASLPLSVWVNSMIHFLLGIWWLAGGEFLKKWERLKQNPAIWIFFGFFLLHLVGMLWTTNTDAGLTALKIKLPLFVIPFIMVTSEPLRRKEMRIILVGFLVGNLMGSAACMAALLGWLDQQIYDYRDTSLFINHIRFSLMMALSIFIAIYLLVFDDRPRKRWVTWPALVSLLWLPVFLVILRSLSGIIISFVLLWFLAFLLVRRVSRPLWRTIATTLLIFIPVFIIGYSVNAVNRFYQVEDVDKTQLDSLTAEGHRYEHRVESEEIENGHYIWLYVSHRELSREWKKVSAMGYNERTPNGSKVKVTLVRYMTSKGLRKDAEGFSHLTPEDIEAVENGIANYIYLNKYAFYPRFYEIIWEFDRYRMGYSPNDKSIVQRLFYLKAGFQVLKQNPWIGTGTGDVKDSFTTYYENSDSPLRAERRRRAHNQYLTLFIAFGTIGGILALASLILPILMQRRCRSYMVIIFLFTMGLSMLNEDTLETTTGAVLFSFFYTLFIFGPAWRWPFCKSRKECGAEA